MKDQCLGRVTRRASVTLSVGRSASDREPGLWIAVRKRGTFGAASLNGRCHGCLCWYRQSPETNIGTSGTWNFDGVGLFNSGGLSNEDGGLSTFTQNGTYSVDSDADAGLTVGRWELRGSVLEGGRLAVLAGSVDDTTLSPWAGTWATDPDASFGFTDAVGGNSVGGLATDGRFAVMGGGRFAGSNPALFFLVR